MEEITQDNNFNTKQTKKLGSGLVFSIVILSVLAGAAAGITGSWYFFNSEIKSVGGILGAKVPVTEDSAIIDVVKDASPAVVSIVASKDVSQLREEAQPFFSPFFLDPFFQQRTPQPTEPEFLDVSAGSGFFITSDGLILTNKHVVSDADAKYTIFAYDGKEYEAEVLAEDPLNDLALVKIDIRNAPFLTFANSDELQIGQRVIAIGNSLGEYKNTVTSGIVSGIGRNVTAGGRGISEQLEGVIQTDAAINPGNSGGPLLNVYGQVIGVNTAMDQQGQLVGFAIPSNDASRSVESYDRFGKIVRPFLGLRYVLVDERIQKENDLSVNYGAWVTPSDDETPAVIKDSAAEKAGIQEGDVVLEINGQRIDQEHTLASIIKKFNPGDTITIKVRRGAEDISLQATLGENG